jgi:2-dehydro-3-deoxyphosphogluconate aldolase / (4S)-4-hydroxy-2-oxoglutarate aldolase
MSENLIAAIVKQKILPLYNHTDWEQVKKAVHTCYAAGMRCFEFTNRSNNAPQVFEQLKNYCTHHLPGMLLGVGTIKSVMDVQLFPDADFMVSPFITPFLLDYTTAKDVLWIPGCSTASEIALAEAAGLQMVKIFPAGLLGGAAYIKAMKDIFPTMKMLATGGMKADRETLQTWWENGTDAVGIGGQLFGKDNIDENKVAAILQTLL